MVLAGTLRLLRGKGDARAGRFDLLACLDLVALATVCDVVPLKGLNRAFVVKGLLAARTLGNAGLAALAQRAGVNGPVTPYHLGYLIGPRINAGGRIGDAALGSRLLTLEDPAEAAAIAERLEELNRERQAIEAAMLAEADAEAAAEMASGEGPAIIVTERQGWHPGVVGLLAARLKERYRRPAFAIAFDGNGKGTGSGRSVPGLDLGRLVRKAVDLGLLVKGGGHAMAAGITVEKSRLGELRAFLEENAADTVAGLTAAHRLKIDGGNFSLRGNAGSDRHDRACRTLWRGPPAAGVCHACAHAQRRAGGRPESRQGNPVRRRWRTAERDRVSRRGHGDGGSTAWWPGDDVSRRRYDFGGSLAGRATGPDQGN